MKTWITTAAITAITLLSATPRAEARQHRGHHSSSYVYVSGYRSCGTPVYTERYLVGYDCHGSPLWRYRTVKAPRHYRPSRGSRHYSAPACPPPRSAYGGFRNGGTVIRGSFRL